MDVLITGVNGFIGRSISTLLINSGHRIIGLDIDGSSQIEGIYEYYSESINNKKILESLASKADVIIHLAAITAHSEIISKKYETLETNLNGTKNILDAFKASKRAKKFIFASTGKVYGEIDELPIIEKSITNPINILGKSKLIAEKLIDFYCDDKKSYVIFRIFQAYGPGQQINFLIPTILSQLSLDMKYSQTITLGDVNAKRDYTFIEDIAAAFKCAISTDTQNGLQIYNISSGAALSAKDIITVIERLLDLKIKIKINEELLRSDETSIEYGSNLKAKNLLSWQPKFSIEDGLKKIIKNL